MFAVHIWETPKYVLTTLIYSQNSNNILLKYSYTLVFFFFFFLSIFLGLVWFRPERVGHVVDVSTPHCPVSTFHNPMMTLFSQQTLTGRQISTEPHTGNGVSAGSFIIRSLTVSWLFSCLPVNFLLSVY